MDMRMVTLENGWTGVAADKPAKADGTGYNGSGFTRRIGAKGKRPGAGPDAGLLRGVPE